MSTAPDYFIKDLERFSTALHAAGAVLPPSPEDGFRGIDPTAVPSALLDAYCALTALGYANGWLS